MNFPIIREESCFRDIKRWIEAGGSTQATRILNTLDSGGASVSAIQTINHSYLRGALRYLVRALFTTCLIASMTNSG